MSGFFNILIVRPHTRQLELRRITTPLVYVLNNVRVMIPGAWGLNRNSGDQMSKEHEGICMCYVFHGKTKEKKKLDEVMAGEILTDLLSQMMLVLHMVGDASWTACSH